MLKHMKVTNLPGHDSWVLLLLLGLACLFFAPLVAPWVTRLAGVVLAVLGLEQSVNGFRSKKYRRPNHLQPSLGLEMIAVGAVALWLGEDALALICAVWGVFGLLLAAHGLNQVLSAAAQRRFSWWKCAVALLEAVLALELIFTSGAAVIWHIRLLGLELLTAAFSYRASKSSQLS